MHRCGRSRRNGAQDVVPAELMLWVFPLQQIKYRGTECSKHGGLCQHMPCMGLMQGKAANRLQPEVAGH